MKSYSLFVLIMLCYVAGLSQNVNVALFHSEKASKYVLNTQKHEYAVFRNDSLIQALPKLTDIHVGMLGDMVVLQSGDSLMQFKESVFIAPIHNDAAFFEIKTVPAKGSVRRYNGKLQFKTQDAVLLAVNKLPLEQYVAAVVEAEGGYNKPFEFYKAQAVITRTYALRNFGRHESEGFELCDATHCQVYKSMATSTDIVNAVKATAGLVLVSDEYELIMAAYHSNSGGQTMNSEDVWVSALPYLKSVPDKYYVYGRNAVWQQNINLSQWQSFLKAKSVDPSIDVDSTLIVSNKRMARVEIAGKSIPLTEVRHFFRLPSAYFSMSRHDDVITFSGRGYGHGVGLSQESAMRMAEEGLSYREILSFFYKGVHLVNMQTVSVFKQFQKLSDN